MNEQSSEGIQAAPLGQYAGFVTRLVAWIIDGLIISAVITVTFAAARLLIQAFPINEWLGLNQFMTQITTGVSVAVAVAIPIIYNIGFWLLAGQTFGKWVMGVRIIRTNGERVRFGTCVRRQIGYVFSAVLFIGYLWILVDNRRQGFHDKIAGTFVVYSWPEQQVFRPIRDAFRRSRFQRQASEGSE
jgi:uncharacterized RDD family membrane protein YckC